MKAYSSVSDRRPAIFCRSTQQSFLRLASTPAVLHQYGAASFTNDDALDALNEFLALPTVSYRDEPSGVVPLWHRLGGRRSAAPKVWMDAYLAAFAIAADLTMVTFDRDFKVFVKDGLQLELLKSV
jgi:toxin-antitoxin system PIN domain toxin